MRATHTSKVACLAIAAAILAALAGAGPAGAAAADCQPYAKKPCLLPFPSNLFTKRDKSSVTGLRVHLPAGAMPVNSKGSRVGVAPYDRNDGFSPGSAIIVHIRGLDNAKAFSRTGAATLANMGRSLRKRQPIVLIDERTGKRQLIWSELDANQTSAGDINLLIHPGKNLLEGHTYVVALRNLRTSGGKLIKAPAWFERLRDGRKLTRAERSQRGRYADIFAALKRAGIARSNLYEAWDFTVASRQSLTSRMLAIRNNAFAQLGDTQPRRRSGAGQRSLVRGDERGCADAADQRGAGKLPGPLLPDHVRARRDDRLSLLVEPARRNAHADRRQQRHRAV